MVANHGDYGWPVDIVWFAQFLNVSALHDRAWNDTEIMPDWSRPWL